MTVVLLAKEVATVMVMGIAIVIVVAAVSRYATAKSFTIGADLKQLNQVGKAFHYCRAPNSSR